MARPVSHQPTELELEILEVLWRDGSCTARRIRESLRTREMSASSVHILLRTMIKKGYLRRERRTRSEGGAVFEALLTRDKVGRKMLKYVVGKIFGGATQPAVQELLKAQDLSEKELKDLRAMLRKQTAGKSDEQSPR
jgi:BlaI family transcriptional regulator, penicillinase repressor